MVKTERYLFIIIIINELLNKFCLFV